MTGPFEDLEPMDTVLSGNALVRSQEQIYVSVYTDYIIIYCIVSIYIGIQLDIKNCAKGTKQDVAMQAGGGFCFPSGDLRHRAPGYKLRINHKPRHQCLELYMVMNSKYSWSRCYSTTDSRNDSPKSSQTLPWTSDILILSFLPWFVVDALIYSSTKLVQVVIRNLSIALLFGSATKRSKETS